MVAFVLRTGTSIHELEILGGWFWPDSVGNQALLLRPVKRVSVEADNSVL